MRFYVDGWSQSCFFDLEELTCLCSAEFSILEMLVLWLAPRQCAFWGNTWNYQRTEILNNSVLSGWIVVFSARFQEL